MLSQGIQEQLKEILAFLMAPHISLSLMPETYEAVFLLIN